LLIFISGVFNINDHVALLFCFFGLQFVEFLFDVRVVEVSDIHAVHEFGHFVEVPLGVVQLVVQLRGHLEHSCAAHLLLEVLGCDLRFDSNVGDVGFRCGRAGALVAFLRLSNGNATQNFVSFLVAFVLLEFVLSEQFACKCLQRADVVVAEGGELNLTQVFEFAEERLHFGFAD